MKNFVSASFVNIFSKHRWLSVHRSRRRPSKNSRPARARYLLHKETARKFVHDKLNELNASYRFTYNKVAIRDQRSRWGSCSTKKNLNFNYRIIDLPEHLADYVIVHELCHLAEFNHSKNFWELVARTIPDHKKRRAAVKRIRMKHR